MKALYPIGASLWVLLLLLGIANAQQPAKVAKSEPVSKNTAPAAPPQAPAQQEKPAGAAVAPQLPQSGEGSNDPLLDVPPLPKGNITLVGGTVKNIDRVRNRIEVQPFGSGSGMKMFFDERTHIYRDGVETTQLGIRKGERVYVDTMLDGHRVFARNIRVLTASQPADAHGQLLSYDAGTGELTMLDRLSSRAVRFHVTAQTAVRLPNQEGTQADLRPGALIAVKFTPERPNSSIAREIFVTAAPGTSFLFAGRVTNVDLRAGILSIENLTDNKIYDIAFSPARMQAEEQLTVGAQVKIQAIFEGKGYRAETVAVEQPQSQ